MSGMADGEGPAGEERLAGIRDAVQELVRQLDGPVARVSVRSGETMIEVEWSRPVAEYDPAQQPEGSAPPAAEAATAPDPGAAEDGGGGHAAAVERSGLHSVLAPLVGTFYVAPEPNASPFVQPGDLVDASTTIGIIEAMKMMNHIGAERAGRVAELLVANGEAVEFGQELVRIEPLDG